MNADEMDLDRFADQRERKVSVWLWAVPLGVGLLAGYYFLVTRKPSAPVPQPPVLRRDMAPDDPLVSRLTKTVEGLEPEGPFLSNIVVERGIRAMDGEIPSEGEVKITVNLAWQSLPQNAGLRDALDRTAARILVEVLHCHDDIDKIRLVLKIPKQPDEVNHGPLGKSLGHNSAAKVFSFTRAAYKNARAGDRQLYDPSHPEGPAAILALGDYVVLTDQGWKRGY